MAVYAPTPCQAPASLPFLSWGWRGNGISTYHQCIRLNMEFCSCSNLIFKSNIDCAYSIAFRESIFVTCGWREVDEASSKIWYSNILINYISFSFELRNSNQPPHICMHCIFYLYNFDCNLHWNTHASFSYLYMICLMHMKYECNWQNGCAHLKLVYEELRRIQY